METIRDREAKTERLKSINSLGSQWDQTHMHVTGKIGHGSNLFIESGNSNLPDAVR